MLMELAELRGQVEALLEAALGGPGHGVSVNALCGTDPRHALFLRSWCATADRPAAGWPRTPGCGVGAARSRRAAAGELVDVRIEGAGAGGRRVLELVRSGLPWRWTARARRLRALEALERSESSERRADERRRVVDFAHPLYGEAVRAQLTPTRVEAITHASADAVARMAGGERRPAADRRLATGSGGDRRRRTVLQGGPINAAAPDVGAGRASRAGPRCSRRRLPRTAGARAGARRPPDARPRGSLLADLRRKAADDHERARRWRWRPRATCFGPSTVPRKRTACFRMPSSS